MVAGLRLLVALVEEIGDWVIVAASVVGKDIIGGLIGGAVLGLVGRVGVDFVEDVVAAGAVIAVVTAVIVVVVVAECSIAILIGIVVGEHVVAALVVVVVEERLVVVVAGVAEYVIAVAAIAREKVVHLN